MGANDAMTPAQTGLLVFAGMSIMTTMGVLAGYLISTSLNRPIERKRQRRYSRGAVNTPYNQAYDPSVYESEEKVSSAREAHQAELERLLTNPERARQISRGASMETVQRMGGQQSGLRKQVSLDEVVSVNQANAALQKNREPREVLLDLQRGNGRFWMGLSNRPELSAMERRALIIAQSPSVCILGCADSRVPVEIVFDQGLGDIFVVRVAGNMLDVGSHGSIEYAINHLKVKVLLVLGHEGCGAVKGAMTMTQEQLDAEAPNLRGLLSGIKENIPLEQLEKITDHRARDREAVVANCAVQMRKLQANPTMQGAVDRGELIIVGAFYEITSGIVDFFSVSANGIVQDL